MRASENFLIISIDIMPVYVRHSNPGLQSQLRHFSVVTRTEKFRGMSLNKLNKMELRLFSLGRVYELSKLILFFFNVRCSINVSSLHPESWFHDLCLPDEICFMKLYRPNENTQPYALNYKV